MTDDQGAKLGCIYWDKCQDAHTDKCKSCRHNPNRSFYEPAVPDPIPRVPYIPPRDPYVPYYPWTITYIY